MTKYYYHYCAQYISKTGDRKTYIDGIVTRPFKLISYEEYSELKKDLIKFFNLNLPTDSNLTITALTLLHEEQAE